MDREKALSLAKDASSLSKQGLELIRKGKYREGHSLMRQAVEAGRQCRQLIEQPKIERGLTLLEQIHSSRLT
jgi:hypothetical protein